jgi:hypothetical protein
MELEFLNACSQGDLATVRTMAPQIDLNYQHPINGMTALHWAYTRNHSHIISFLKENGALTLKDSKGRYPEECSTNLKLNYMKSVQIETMEEMKAWNSAKESQAVEMINSKFPSQPPVLDRAQIPTEKIPCRRLYVFSSANEIMGQILVTNQVIHHLVDVLRNELNISVTALFNYTMVHGTVRKVPIHDRQFDQCIFDHFEDCIYVDYTEIA